MISTVPFIHGKISKKYSGKSAPAILSITGFMKEVSGFTPLKIRKAESNDMKHLRDVSIHLSREYTTSDLYEIAESFDIDLEEVQNILENDELKFQNELSSWKIKLEHRFGLAYAWDDEYNCYLTAKRASFILAEKEIVLEEGELYELELLPKTITDFTKENVYDSLTTPNIKNMGKLYLDEIRTPNDNGYVVVRSCADAIDYVKSNGVPSFISFDHDLGIDENGNILPSGYDFAKWLIEADLNGEIDFLDVFPFAVHSQNPVGKENIEKLLKNYFRVKFFFLSEEELSAMIRGHSKDTIFPFE